MRKRVSCVKTVSECRELLLLLLLLLVVTLTALRCGGAFPESRAA